MGTRADHVEKTAVRALRRRGDLLATWLDLLNQFDNPMRRRAARFRQEQRCRRDISVIRGPRMRDLCSGLAAPRSRPDVWIVPTRAADSEAQPPVDAA
jgi:hypothetical protein